MDKITTKTLEIVRGYAYNKNRTITDILEACDLSRAWLTKVRKTDGSFTVKTCMKLLEECGYTLEIKRK